MSNNYDNHNSGAIFPNDRKRSANSPNATGSCEIECPNCGETTKFWMSAWKKVSKAGKNFMSFAFTPDDPDANKAKAQARAEDFDYDDDLPF